MADTVLEVILRMRDEATGELSRFGEALRRSSRGVREVGRTFNEVSQGLIIAAAATTRFGHENSAMGQALLKASGAVAAMSVVFTTLGGIIPGVVVGVKAIGAAMMFLAANPVGLLVTAVAGLVAAFFIFRDKIPAVFEIVGNAVEKFVNFFLTAYRPIIKTINAIAGLFSDFEIPESVDFEWRQFGETVKGVADNVADFAGGAIKMVPDLFDKTSQATKSAATEIKRVQDQVFRWTEQGIGLQDLLGIGIGAGRGQPSPFRLDAFLSQIRGGLNELANFTQTLRPRFSLPDISARPLTQLEQLQNTARELADALPLQRLSNDIRGATEFFFDFNRAWVEAFIEGKISLESYIATWKQLKDGIEAAKRKVEEFRELIGPGLTRGLTPEQAFWREFSESVSMAGGLFQAATGRRLAPAELPGFGFPPTVSPAPLMPPGFSPTVNVSVQVGDERLDSIIGKQVRESR